MQPFIISPSSGIPIYRQLMEQIRRMVARKNLQAGDQLPSIRQLAVQLEVNPMTISKAYSQLETEGLLTRQRGIGMVVSDKQPEQLPLAQRIELLSPTIEKLLIDAEQLDIDGEQLVNAIKNQITIG